MRTTLLLEHCLPVKTGLLVLVLSTVEHGHAVLALLHLVPCQLRVDVRCHRGWDVAVVLLLALVHDGTIPPVVICILQSVHAAGSRKLALVVWVRHVALHLVRRRNESKGNHGVSLYIVHAVHHVAIVVSKASGLCGRSLRLLDVCMRVREMASS